MGALQEIDQPPLLKPITKSAITSHSIADLEADTYKAFEIARTPHRGPTFLDIPMDVFFSPGIPKIVNKWQEPKPHCDTTEVSLIADLVNAAVRPLLILGSDVWAGRAEREALAFAENSLIPVITNGTARGIIPRGHQLLATKARSYVMKNTDLVIVVGTPLDFRLGYGDFGSARVIHIMDENSGIAKHVSLAASTTGDFRAIFQELTNQIQFSKNSDWITAVKEQNAKGAARDQELLLAEGDLIHPARIYGELLPHLSDDTVVIGDNETGRTKSVAVQCSTDYFAIGEGDGSGTIPRLHQVCMVFVEVFLLLAHVFVAVPHLGNQHHHHMWQGATAVQQQLNCSVQV